MPGSLARSLLSFIVPPLCAVCREPELSGAAICAACAASLQAIGTCCRVCGAPHPRPVDFCTECRRRNLAFERAWAPFAYSGAARRLVLGLKAGGLLRNASYMGAAIASRAPPGLLGGILVPAPAHSERMWRHGHNQAGELAAALGRASGLPVRDLLARRLGGRPQAGLERAARRANARGWIVATGAVPRGERLTVVDDVYTTGATLDACARALRAAGSGAVTAVCFARTVRELPTLAPRAGAA
jgi:predicted amidophosphoribosyltransferase